MEKEEDDVKSLRGVKIYIQNSFKHLCIRMLIGYERSTSGHDSRKIIVKHPVIGIISRSVKTPLNQVFLTLCISRETVDRHPTLTKCSPPLSYLW